ncbi:MAG: DUF2344 domain-containing protein [Clostridia bacterium]|nr:DUF2344 domain-containing protein [Clostridia bacterium]
MIRIVFEKKDTAIYMSHLDLMRCMTRALTRAEIPVKFTEGFNPHPYLVFAAPLALGISGEREYFEIKITEEMAYSEMKDRLNETLPQGLKVLDVLESENDFNDIESANYQVFVEGKSAEDWSSFFASETIPAEKKTKRGMETIDLKTEIFGFRFTIQVFNVIALPILALYNGKVGTRKLKYFFYAFYPAHLGVIMLIKMIIDALVN